jgi:hypothetical protein
MAYQAAQGQSEEGGRPGKATREVLEGMINGK